MSVQVGPFTSPAPLAERAREGAFAVACSALFALQLRLIWAHMPWLDELQAFLLARDTHDLAGWWSNFRYEGHAPLWHLLIKLCLMVSEGPESLKLAQSLCAGVLFALVIWRSPFPWWGRLLLCSNYFLLFEYGVIARDYSLGVTLCFAAVAFRAHWASWGLIALVPQAGLQFIIVAGLLVLMQWDDQRRPRAGLVVALAGMALAFIQMRPNADFNAIGSLIAQGSPLTSLLVTLRYAGTALIPVDHGGHLLGWSELAGPTAFVALVAAGAMVPILAILASRRMPIFAWGVPLLAFVTYALSIFVYSLFPRHFGLIVVLLVVALWRHPQVLHSNILASGWLALLSLSGLLALSDDAWKPFSSAPAIAARLRDADLAGLPIIPVDTMLGVEPAAFNQVETVNMTNQCWQTFVRWKGPVFLPPFEPSNGATSESNQAGAEAALAAIEAMAAHLGGKAVVILDRKALERLQPVMRDHMQLVANFSAGLGPIQQRNLYLLRTAPSVDRKTLPACGT